MLMKSLAFGLLLAIFGVFVPACGEPEEYRIKIVMDPPEDFEFRDMDGEPCSPEFLGTECPELGEYNEHHCRCQPEEEQKISFNDPYNCNGASPLSYDCGQNPATGGVWRHKNEVSAAVWDVWESENREVTICYFWTPRAQNNGQFGVRTFTCRKVREQVWTTLSTAQAAGPDSRTQAPTNRVEELLISLPPSQQVKWGEVGVHLMGHHPAALEEMWVGQRHQLHN